MKAKATITILLRHYQIKMSLQPTYRRILLVLMTMLAWMPAAFAQQEIEMADNLRAEGKIYVVVVCLTIIVIGLLLYVARLDRKIGQLEKGK